MAAPPISAPWELGNGGLLSAFSSGSDEEIGMMLFSCLDNPIN